MRDQDWSSSSSSSSSCRRILREYDFFSEASNKLIQVHVLPLPQNPDALQEFFLPELISPANKLKKTPVGKGKMVESGIVIKNEEPLIPAAPTAGAFLFGKRLDDSPATFPTETDQELGPSIVYNPTLLRRVIRSEIHRQMETVINPNPNPNPPKFHEKINTPVHKEIRADSNKLMKTLSVGLMLSSLGKGNGPKEAIPPEPVFLFYKRLEDSDLKHRLLIPKSESTEKLMGFLTEQERIKVQGGGGVTVILELKGGDQELVLAKKNDDVLLVKDHDWSTVFSELDDLMVGDHLYGWGYRRHEDDAKLRLQINHIIDGPTRLRYYDQLSKS